MGTVISLDRVNFKLRVEWVGEMSKGVSRVLTGMVVVVSGIFSKE